MNVVHRNVIMDTTERRQNLKEALVGAAERAIEARGLTGLKARELAAEAGCALGAIYNVVDDLDDLVLAVNSRTLAMLAGELAGAAGSVARGRAIGPPAVGQLVRLATAYLAFAADHTLRWRALFEHRLAVGKATPAWYQDEQRQLFALIEQPLRGLRPGLPPGELALLARSLFSAVHGVVALGLEEKLGALSLPVLRAQTAMMVEEMGAGLATQ
jgi:AcrR family transcriptional regulator